MRTPARREKDRLRKQRKAEERAAGARLHAIAAAARIEREEAALELEEEAVVSRALRKAVVTQAGVMLLGPRLQVINGSPARVDPLAALSLTERRRRAGRQLQTDWREVGEGCGVGAVDYMRAGGGGDGEGGHAAMRRQIDSHKRLRGALTAAGAMAPLLRRVVLDGIPLAMATAEDGRIADGKGWLEAGLDRLAEFYWPVRDGVVRERALTFGPAREAYALEGVSDE